jgi:hypothetical protein
MSSVPGIAIWEKLSMSQNAILGYAGGGKSSKFLSSRTLHFWMNTLVRPKIVSLHIFRTEKSLRDPSMCELLPPSDAVVWKVPSNRNSAHADSCLQAPSNKENADLLKRASEAVVQRQRRSVLQKVGDIEGTLLLVCSQLWWFGSPCSYDVSNLTDCPQRPGNRCFRVS